VKIVTWNVNSIRIRLDHVSDFLTREAPDILLLQEIKCEDAAFPYAHFLTLGYHAHIVGQKSYNGVALLTRETVEITHRALPGLPVGDAHARYIEARLQDIVIGGLYLPNGNSGGDEGYRYKLAWMDALHDHARTMLEGGVDFVLAGDFNICPQDIDFAPGSLPTSDALVRPESRAAWRKLCWLGLTDALRALEPDARIYTFWDYQAGAWQRDQGLRIDHALLSPRIAERLVSVTPVKSERDKPQPSDHVPVIIEID
jgi:exodeoxyribonuclease-3